MQYWNDADFMGNDISSTFLSTVEKCMDHCFAHDSCQAFTYRNSDEKCWIKTTVANVNMNYGGLISGMRCSYQTNEKPKSPPDGSYPSGIISTSQPRVIFSNFLPYFLILPHFF